MSPSSSIQPTSHSRQTSQTQYPFKAIKEESQSSKQSSAPPTSSSPILAPVSSSAHYTVFVRLPFNRHGFEDPAPVEWDAIKDKALWKIISKAGKSKDIDWEDMSLRFGVGLGFLLQQAAWLYERHFEDMKAQMKKLSVAGDGGSGSGSGMGSGVATSAPRKESPALPANPPSTGSGLDGSPSAVSPKAEIRPAFSRTPSTATVTQSRVFATPLVKPQGPLQRALRNSSGSGRRPTPPAQNVSTPRDDYYEDAIEHEGLSGSDSEEEPSAMARSQAFRRAPLGSRKSKMPANRRKPSSDADGEAEPGEDDDEDSGEGGYLPFAGAARRLSSEDPSATLRDPTKHQAHFSGNSKPRTELPTTTTTTSSASSASNPPGPLSPRHRAQLVSLSPRSRKDGSEGSPSMGSSFSDLDDTSVTQSALEEAALSNMRAQGGSSMASRMSSLRDAIGRRAGGGN